MGKEVTKADVVRAWAESLRALGMEQVILDAPNVLSAGAEDGLHLHLTREDLLRKEAALAQSCRKCRLASARAHAVYGAGNAYAEIMLVGEAPGAEEDRQGLPFVGRAGQLLNKLLEQVRLKRSDVYICNIVKCRPPGNRDPLPDEITACRPFLEKQINVIKPRVICCLGLPAAHAILNRRESMAKLRGSQYKIADMFVVPTYHTAAALRFPIYKQYIYEDLCRVRDLAFS